MKNLKTLFAVVFLAILTSCGTTKETTKDATKSSTVSTETNRGRSNQSVDRSNQTVDRTNQTVDRTKTDTSQNSSSGKSITAANTKASDDARNIEAADKARMEKMYSSLNWDEEQISRFENEWKNSTNQWKRSNRGKTMNSFERTEYQDRIMKDILDDDQFGQYQEWARENPIID